MRLGLGITFCLKALLTFENPVVGMAKFKPWPLDGDYYILICALFTFVLGPKSLYFHFACSTLTSGYCVAVHCRLSLTQMSALLEPWIQLSASRKTKGLLRLTRL